MKEPRSNIVKIHKTCASRRKIEWQANHSNLVLKAGMFAKLAIHDRKKIEHMWVKIIEIGNPFLTGILDNDPIIIKNFRCGDIVTFTRDEIEQHIEVQ